MRYFWRYQLVLILLYLLWGNFFTTGGIINQVGFNFAVFYPVGFWAGYTDSIENFREAFAAVIVFNIITYLIAIFSGLPMGPWVMIGVDFFSMFVIVTLGILIGRKAKPVADA